MNFYETIGQIADLMCRSPIHRAYTIGHLANLVAPPILAGQFAVVKDSDAILAFGSFALLTEKSEAEFLEGKLDMRPHHWNEGDRLWLMDIIAPYGHAAVVARALRDNAKSKGFTEVRFRRNKPGVGRRYARASL